MCVAINIRHVTVNYGALEALTDITAAIPARRITAVIGPNGSGKSTLLKAILGLLPLQGGSVRVMGKPFSQVRDAVAYVPQKEDIDWHYPLLVWEAVALGRCRPGRLLRPLTLEDRHIVHRSLQELGLTSLARRPIGQLSGGQKQRVILARALARQADLFLLDEPFNGVDAATEEIIMNYIQSLKNRGKTVVIVHHKLDEVYSRFDQTMLLNRRLISFGPTSQVFREDLIFTAYHQYPPRGLKTEKTKKCLTCSGS